MVVPSRWLTCGGSGITNPLSMPVRPCPNVINCPGTDEPISNYSSEANDTLDYVSTFFAGQPPPFLQDWVATECGDTYLSTISQADADYHARANAELCVHTRQNTSPTIYFNSPQTCTLYCPDGLPFTYTVQGGMFTGSDQTLVNLLALEFACNQANANKICLSNLAGCLCLNQSFTGTITATSSSAVTWQVIGILPPGLSVTSVTPFTLTISGVPTISGPYTFQVQATSKSGLFNMTKNYTLNVLDIAPIANSLHATAVGNTYSVTFADATGCAVPALSWQVVAGALPPGLTLNEETGVLSGIPTTAGTYSWTILLQDSST